MIVAARGPADSAVVVVVEEVRASQPSALQQVRHPGMVATGRVYATSGQPTSAQCAARGRAVLRRRSVRHPRTAFASATRAAIIEVGGDPQPCRVRTRRSAVSICVRFAHRAGREDCRAWRTGVQQMVSTSGLIGSPSPPRGTLNCRAHNTARPNRDR